VGVGLVLRRRRLGGPLAGDHRALPTRGDAGTQTCQAKKARGSRSAPTNIAATAGVAVAVPFIDRIYHLTDRSTGRANEDLLDGLSSTASIIRPVDGCRLIRE
jgi:hypothetical protein